MTLIILNDDKKQVDHNQNQSFPPVQPFFAPDKKPETGKNNRKKDSRDKVNTQAVFQLNRPD